MTFDQWLDKPIHGGSGPTRRAYYSDNALTAARDAWAAATAAESEDAQRLDWLGQKEGCNLVSDDCGMWAVSDGGWQPVPEEGGFKEHVCISSFVEPEQWKPSIREAIDASRSRGGKVNETANNCPGLLSIGTTDDRRIVVFLGRGTDVMTTQSAIISPALARVYAAMLMALADQMEPQKAASE